MLMKIGVLLVILWAVWTGFRLLERRAKSGAVKKAPPKPEAVDMTECHQCAAWVAKTGCNRASCPLRK